MPKQFATTIHEMPTIQMTVRLGKLVYWRMTIGLMLLRLTSWVLDANVVLEE